TADIVSLARPVSAWGRQVKGAGSIAHDTAEAIAAAGSTPGHISTLIVPSDCQWSEADGPAPKAKIDDPSRAADNAVAKSADLLRKHGAKTTLFLGAQGTRARGLAAAGRIAAKTGCTLMCETFPARIERGGRMPAVVKLPYFPEQALEMLGNFDAVVL